MVLSMQDYLLLVFFFLVLFGLISVHTDQALKIHA